MSAEPPPRAPSAAYLRGLSANDLVLIARAGGLDADDPAELARLRADGDLLERLLGSDALDNALLGDAEDPERETLFGGSPFLMFAVAMQRTLLEVDQVRFVPEWIGPRMRIPVLEDGRLGEFLGDRNRQLFLVELLASYTRVASGTMWRDTPRGRTTVRFSELDLMRLAALLDAVPEERRAMVHRRLGDLALFLAGVFPDHTAGRLFRPIDLQRLGRAASVAGHEGLGEALELHGGVGLLEVLGTRWYRLAAAPLEPAPASRLSAIADRFVEARRALNLITDRYLFPVRNGWLPAP
ncbi:MAG: hypothetical protein QOD86_3074 [Miltoncostaeaceae bacterium]|nr:hypothetical protein [Miltoncostaeaceae bacterium]